MNQRQRKQAIKIAQNSAKAQKMRDELAKKLAKNKEYKHAKAFEKICETIESSILEDADTKIKMIETIISNTKGK